MTKEQKHNKRLYEIVEPEVRRLEKREKISENILEKLEKMVEIDTCGLAKCHLINAIGREIDTLII